MMTCREVDQAWNRRLDSVRLGSSPADAAESLPTELESHLSRCPSCRSRAAGYAALAQAIGGLGGMPVPSESLSRRILAEFEADPRPVIGPIRRGRTVARWASVAAAAALVVAGVRFMRPGPGAVPGAPSTPEVLAEAPPRPLTEAVAEAAEATVAIARKTSEPAARIGRDVFGGGGAAGVVADGGQIALEMPLSPPSGGTAERVVTLIGNSLEAGVRPLSKPTRSAFSFLLPSLPQAEDPPPADQGV
jgi:predicted anti-sigma-YlaC factor YlaD